jgi:uncharacterized protein (TIGR03437 family)
MIPFVGATTLTRALTPIAPFTQVYKAETSRLHPLAFPTIAQCGGRMLKNISPGPIRDENVYSFCIGAACVPGAGERDAFLNCPPPINATESRCDQAAAGNAKLACVADMAPFAQSITQFYLDPAGTRSRVLSNGFYAMHSPRTPTTFDTAFSLPDGSWVVFGSWGNNGRKDLYMLKVPPQPEFPPDPKSGSMPITQSVSLTPPDGTEQVVVQHSNIQVQQSCRGGASCTVDVPSRPLEVVFGKASFRGPGGQPVAEVNVQPRLSSGVAGSGLGKPRTAASDPLLNGFSFEPKLAPGAIVSIFGQDLADCEARAQALPLPTRLCGAGVILNGSEARLFYAGPTQINALLPGSLAPQQDIEVVVDRNGQKSDPVRAAGASVAEVAPAIAPYSLDGTVIRAAVQNSDKTIAGPDRPDLGLRPLKLGEAAALYATALGPTDPRVNDGDAAPQEPPARTVNEVEVYVNDVRQPTSFAGLTPGLSALYQVNFTLDPSTPVKPGEENQVWIKVKDVESPRVVLSIAP